MKFEKLKKIMTTPPCSKISVYIKTPLPPCLLSITPTRHISTALCCSLLFCSVLSAYFISISLCGGPMCYLGTKGKREGTLLYYSILYCTVWYCVLQYTIQNCTVDVLYCTVWYCVLQYTIQNCTVDVLYCAHSVFSTLLLTALLCRKLLNWAALPHYIEFTFHLNACTSTICTALYWIILYFIIAYCTVPYCHALSSIYCIVLHYTALLYTALPSIKMYCTRLTVL